MGLIGITEGAIHLLLRILRHTLPAIMIGLSWCWYLAATVLSACSSTVALIAVAAKIILPLYTLIWQLALQRCCNLLFTKPKLEDNK